MARVCLTTSKSGLVAVACSNAALLFESSETIGAPTLLRPTPPVGPEAGPGPQGIIQRDERVSEEAQRAVVGMAFNGDCSLLVVADGDKTVRVWDVVSKQCIAVHRFGKKLTCVDVAPLSEASATEAVLVADKTGEVWALPLPSLAGAPVSVLQHTASIVTGLAVTSGGRRLVSCDRDEKVRVSQWPTTCLIDAFCLGHTDYVAAVALASTQSGGEVLVSISGDGTLRCWDTASGACLAMHAFPDSALPVALATSHAGNTTAAGAALGKVAVAFANSTVAAVLSLDGFAREEADNKDGDKQEATKLLASEVTLPSIPSALAFTANGNLLALSDSAPYLHTIDCTNARASLAVAPSALAPALTSAINQHSLKVLPALVLTDADLIANSAATPGEGGEDDTSAEAPPPPLEDSHELRKRKDAQPVKDWNDASRFKGLAGGPKQMEKKPRTDKG